MVPEIIAPTQYVYNARLKYEHKSHPIYDGDSMRLIAIIKIDLGFGIKQTTEYDLGMVRIFGIDAPELRGDEREAGLMTRDEVRRILGDLDTFVIKTYKDDKGKYGRYLVTIYLPDGNTLSGYLLENNLAEVYS